MDNIKNYRTMISLVAGFTSCLIGAIVILGWYTGNVTLIQIFPTFVPMQYNTALGFLLSGVGLVALVRGYSRTTVLFGGVVAAIGLLTLIEYIFVVDLGIDQLLMDHYVTTQTSHPGRMAPNTALCFFLTGSTLLGSSFIHIGSFVKSSLRALGVLVFVLGFVAFVGYIGKLETAYGWAHLTRMAVHTAFGFIFLGIGLASYFWIEGALRVNKLSAYWISSSCSIIVAILSIALWQKLDKTEVEAVRNTQKQEALIIASDIRQRVDAIEKALLRMRERWEFRENLTEEEWRRDASNYLRDHNAMTNLVWVSAQDNTVWHEFDSETVKANKLPDVLKNRIKEYRTGKQFHTKISLDSSAPSGGLIFVMPVVGNGKITGAISGYFDIRKLIQDMIPSFVFLDYNLELLIQEQNFVFGEKTSSDKYDTSWEFATRIKISDQEWLFSTWPRKKLLDKKLTYVPLATLLFGAFLALVINIIVSYAIKVSRLVREIREVSDLNQLILDNAGEGIYGIDNQGHTTFCNKAAVETLGYTIPEMVGKEQHSLIHHHLADGNIYPRNECQIYKTIQDGKVRVEDQEVFWTKDNKAIPVEYTCRPVKGVDGAVQGAVVVFRDITERKAAQDQLFQYTKALERSNIDLEEFAYVASHDLKAPLRVIDNASLWLEEDLEQYLDDDCRENMQLLRSRVSRMERLLDDLLEYSRITKKLGDAPGNVISGQEMFENIIELLSPPSGFNVNVSELFLKSEYERMPLQQILYNLINNGIKHHDKEQGEITVTVKDEGAFNKFTVQDDGPGIAPKYHDKVFKIFQTLRPRDEVEGSGVGLAVVRKTVESLNGTLILESDVGKGASFTFTLPKHIENELAKEAS